MQFSHSRLAYAVINRSFQNEVSKFVSFCYRAYVVSVWIQDYGNDIVNNLPEESIHKIKKCGN